MFYRLLLTLLRTYVEKQDEWGKCLPLVVYAYQIAVHTSTGYSLFMLFLVNMDILARRPCLVISPHSNKHRSKMRGKISKNNQVNIEINDAKCTKMVNMNRLQHKIQPNVSEMQGGVQAQCAWNQLMIAMQHPYMHELHDIHKEYGPHQNVMVIRAREE